MAVEKVNWELTEGIRSMAALVQMVREAAVNCGAERTEAGGAMDFCGHNFTVAGRVYWMGIIYSQPQYLQFEAFGVKKNIAEKIGFGTVEPCKLKDENTYLWRNGLDLTSEPVHFFARTKSNQIQCIEQFLKESIQASAASLKQREKSA